MRSNTIACLTATSILLASGVAGAQEDEEIDATSGSVGIDILFGWGMKDDPNPYKTGVGLRGGYYMYNGVSVAGTYVYHFGHSEEITLGGQSTEIKYGISFAGVEGGYRLPIDAVGIRPYLGAGLGMFRSEYGEQSDTENKLSLWPGAKITIPLGGLALGLEGRYYVVTGIDDNPQTDTDESTVANAFAMYGGFSFGF